MCPPSQSCIICESALPGADLRLSCPSSEHKRAIVTPMQVLDLEEEGKLNMTVRLKKRALQGAYDQAIKKKKVNMWNLLRQLCLYQSACSLCSSPLLHSQPHPLTSMVPRPFAALNNTFTKGCFWQEEASRAKDAVSLPVFNNEYGHGVPEQRPENSVYYHPTLNPSGVPPPGKPQRYRTDPAAGPRVPLPLPAAPPLPAGPAPGVLQHPSVALHPCAEMSFSTWQKKCSYCCCVFLCCAQRIQSHSMAGHGSLLGNVMSLCITAHCPCCAGRPAGPSTSAALLPPPLGPPPGVLPPPAGPPPGMLPPPAGPPPGMAYGATSCLRSCTACSYHLCVSRT